MSYTVTSDHPNGSRAVAHVDTREEADAVYGSYLRQNPHGEVKLTTGDGAVLVSVGDRRAL